jgi:SNF2 family DNA or RNA helicase
VKKPLKQQINKESTKMELPLYTYQHTGVSWLLERERTTQTFQNEEMPKGGILADEVGLGKTMMTIALCNANPKYNTLILAPKSIINQWANEISKHAPHIKVTISYDDKFTINDDPDIIHIVLASHSRLNSKGVNNIERTVYAKVVWDRIIIDEAHVIKNKRSKIHKACAALQSPIKWGLTATPVMNKMTDFVYILDFIGVSQSLCQNYKDDISEMYILRRTKEDVQCDMNKTLPQLSVTVECLEFESAEEQTLYLDVYNEIRERIIAMNDNEQKNTIQVLELLLRIRQVCCNPQCFLDGFAKKEKTSPELWTYGCTKVNHIVGKISQTHEKTLIFCHFIKEMDAYSTALKAINVDSYKLDGSLSIDERSDIVQQFSKNDVQVLIIQIHTGAVGFNLQCANNIHITSPMWNPALQHQVIGRAHRNGQTKPVNVYIYAMSSSNANEVYIEQYILRLQQRKREMISDVLNDTRIKNEGECYMQQTNIGSNITFNDVFKMFQRKMK